MLRKVKLHGWTLVIGVLGITGVPASAEVRSDQFYRAYFLEAVEGKCSEAAALYRDVIADPAAGEETRQQAKNRLAGCEEEIAASDFAALMPATTLAYLELRQPGEQLSTLLGQLGLLASGVEKASKASGPTVAVSPALIRELFGIRGLGVALTGVDAMKQRPMGVAVLHPGNLGVIRAILETALPAGAVRGEPVAGFETYQVENQAFVTLTARLVVVGTDRAQIEGVIRRLRGKEKSSLANSEALAEMMKGRGNSVFFLAVNAKPVMPMLNAMMLAASAASPEAAMVQQMLDVNAIHSLVIRGGVNEQGITGDITLRLDKGHHNLAYHFLRVPPLQADALKSIPAGAAGFVALSLNPMSAGGKAPPEGSNAKPYVSFMDLGREVFANLVNVSVAVLQAATESSPAPGKMPDVVASLTVNDPAKTQMLWSQFLGLASLAAGGGTMEGSASDIDGQPVRSYPLPGGVTLHTAIVGNDFVLATTNGAMQASLQARRGGGSILKDKTFTEVLGQPSPATTVLVAVNPGRCAAIARRFAPPDEAATIEPFIELLKDTVVSLTVDHAEEIWHAGLRIQGLPDVGPMVSQFIQKQRQSDEQLARLQELIRGRQWNEALTMIEQQLAEQPGDGALRRRKFDLLATGKKDVEAAAVFGAELCASYLHGATVLNNFAWALLTEEEYGGAFAELARDCSRRSNDLSGFKNWRFLDTLALAHFEVGDVAGAIELQKQAIEQFDGSGLRELQKSLARFEEKARAAQLVTSHGS